MVLVTRRDIMSPGVKLVVCESIRFSLGAVDAGEDLVGVLGPGNRPGVVVPGVDECSDAGYEFFDDDLQTGHAFIRAA
jgi:hypothetical protein